MKKCTVEIVLDDLLPLEEDEINIGDIFGNFDEAALKK